MNPRRALPFILLVSVVLGACAAAAPSQRSAILPGPVVQSSQIGGLAPEAPRDLSNPTVGELKAAPGAGQPAVDRLVIRNANISLVVHDPAASVDKIGALAESLGGFVVTSNIIQTTYPDSGVTANQASITIRVPVEKLDDALKQIKAEAVEVRSQNVTGEDVTQQYTDLQSRLRNLEAAEAQLREIMASATKTEDVMMVYNQLVQVRGEIESVKGQIQYFDQSAKLSAISVELIPDVAARPLQIGNWQPQGTAKSALEALIRALQFLGNAVIWAVICVLPVALILGLPAYFVIRAIVRRRRAAKARQAQA